MTCLSVNSVGLLANVSPLNIAAVETRARAHTRTHAATRPGPETPKKNAVKATLGRRERRDPRNQTGGRADGSGRANGGRR